jgi:hypothetical protein
MIKLQQVYKLKPTPTAYVFEVAIFNNLMVICTGIWTIKCHTGSEQTLVRSILMKTIHNQQQGKPVLIKSCFCTPSAGYIYVEAMEEPFAREAISG